MKRTFIMILALIIATTAVAAPAQHGQRPPGGRGGGILPPKALADLLDLTDQQIAQIDSLREAQKSLIQPLREKQRANREAMEAALAAGDSAKAGELAMAGYNTRQQIKAAHEKYDASFTALLTPAQKAKWDTYQEILQLRRHRPEDEH